MPRMKKKQRRLPRTYQRFVARFPELGAAHEAAAHAIDGYGPLDHKTCHLIKIGISIGAGLESATKSHVRRAMLEGASEEEIEQAIVLAMNTCGFPRTVAGWRWAREQMDRGVG